MIDFIDHLQRRIRPELHERPSRLRYLIMSDVIGVLYSLPLALIGLAWLIHQTDWSLLLTNYLWMPGIFIAIVIISRLRFYIMQSLHSGHLIASDGDFVGVILWASLLVFGPSIIWLFLIWYVVEFLLSWKRSVNKDMRWNSLRAGCLNAATLLIPALVGLEIYQGAGGMIPMSSLQADCLVPALLAVFSYAMLYFLVWLPYILYVIWVQRTRFDLQSPARLFWFSLVTIELPFIALPIGVLASGILAEHGLLVMGIYSVSLLLIALLANQLSLSAEKSRRQANILMGLEQLGRDILAAPTDARSLPSLLRKHLPEMFPCRRAVVWIAPETYLLKYPDGKETVSPTIWNWLLAQKEPQAFLGKETFPWDEGEQDKNQNAALLTAPILKPASGEAIGGLFIELQSMPQRWDNKSLEAYTPALQNLASQVATALQQADILEETLIHQHTTQELRLAGDIQMSFLPNQPPSVPGWDIAARLEPARQTAGDFYDFFHLEGGRLGIIIADVADKGLGAALYMALGRTLLLTYAHQYPENPAAVLHATNQRMLSDARAQMFITAFYGVLEPERSRMIYCNAGHHPPILISNDVQRLNPNGMALGLDPDAAWVAVSQRITVDDTLLLYTDGVVETDRPDGEFYGTERLITMTRKAASRPSQWVIRGIWDDLLRFRQGTPQSDDITLVCIRRRE